MNTHTLAAEVLIRLTERPGTLCAVDSLAVEIGVPIPELAGACTLLHNWMLLDGAVSGGVALPATRPEPVQQVVLVIENTPAVAHVLDALLDSDGYRVLLVSNLNAGLRLLESVRPMLVITDSFSGTARDALDRLQPVRAAASPEPVLIFTAHRDVDEEEALAAGYAGLLPKPFDIDDLLDRVHRVTDGEAAG